MVVTVAQPQLPQRRNRYPRHTWKIRAQPFALTPFMLAPVLPGETMENMLIQSRAVTDPINDPLAGWWLEYFVFYVKLTDLDQREEFQQMIIRPDDFSKAGLTAAAQDTLYYTAEGGIEWSKFCMKRVVEEYFRNEGEAWDAFNLFGFPGVAAFEERHSWMQSLVMGDDVNLLDVSISTAGDNAFTMSELEAAKREYEISKAYGLQLPSWEDYLVQNGVRAAAIDDPHRPELVRHIREWTYPTNTVDPSNGTPRSAASWAIRERADKKRYFKEPGFLFGVQTARPKVYAGNQRGTPAGFMDSPEMWLPALLMNDAWSSMQAHVTNSDSGPLPGITDAQGYMWDMRDLLLYGDQHLTGVNYTGATVTNNSLMGLPTSGAQKDYVTEAMVNSLFVGGGETTPINKVVQDGVCQLTIRGRQVDTTPPGSGSTFMA